MKTLRRIDLKEASPGVDVALTNGEAAEVARLQIATVAPIGDGEWRVSAVRKVGVMRVGSVELRIEPKVPLDRLFFVLSRTLGWDAWLDEDAQLSSVDDLYPAIAALFARSAERVLDRGIIRDYRETRASEPQIRGRWLISEQIRTRQGLPLPAEIVFDDFTVDVDENRMLRSASQRLLRLAGTSAELRRRLRRVESALSGASSLVRGTPVPTPAFTRRNAHYRDAVGLAKLILEGASLDHGVATVSAAGFLLNVATLFEQFIAVELTRAAGAAGGTIQAQRSDHLDHGAQVVIRPDLVWLDDGVVAAVFDAKYKADRNGRHPNADIYQMLAYCVRHGLRAGHLVYAAGNEEPARYIVEQAGVTIICHAVDLDQTPRDIQQQLDAIAADALALDD